MLLRCRSAANILTTRSNSLRTSTKQLTSHHLSSSSPSPLFPSSSSSLPSSLFTPSSFLNTIFIRHATKKSGGSTQNSSGTAGKRLGLKAGETEKVETGRILIRQRGQAFMGGLNTFMGRDHTIHAGCDGVVYFHKVFRSWKVKKSKYKAFVSVLPFEFEKPVIDEYMSKYESLCELYMKLKLDHVSPLTMSERASLMKRHANSPEIIEMHTPKLQGTPLQIYYELERQVFELKNKIVVNRKWTAQEKKEQKEAREILMAQRAIPKPKREVKLWTDAPVSVTQPSI